MKILPVRTIENDVYTTFIKPSEFGTATMTHDAEISMLKDTPKTLAYVDIDFKEKFKVVDGLPVISTDPDAVEVELKLNNKEFLLDENFEVNLSVDANKISASEIDGVVLTDKYLVAQAKVITYETKVLTRIKELLDEARGHMNTFEDTVEVNL